jgi:hypothetical protein
MWVSKYSMPSELLAQTTEQLPRSARVMFSRFEFPSIDQMKLLGGTRPIRRMMCYGDKPYFAEQCNMVILVTENIIF